MKQLKMNWITSWTQQIGDHKTHLLRRLHVSFSWIAESYYKFLWKCREFSFGVKTSNLSLIQTAARAGLDHPEKVELYVGGSPGSVRVIGYKVMVHCSQVDTLDWLPACNRVREWERDSKIRNVMRIWTAGI